MLIKHITTSDRGDLFDLYKRFIAQKVYITCARTGSKIVPLTNLNKYQPNDTSETEVNLNISVNNDSEKL